MSKYEKFICGDCNSVLEFDTAKRGSKFVSILLWSTLVIPGLIYDIWRSRKVKKICYYCGSDFVFEDSLQAREFIKPIAKKLEK